MLDVNSFFLEKINTIRSSIIGSSDADIQCPPLDASFSKCELLCFQPVKQDQVSKIIKGPFSPLMYYVLHYFDLGFRVTRNYRIFRS